MLGAGFSLSIALFIAVPGWTIQNSLFTLLNNE
jgi:hypothetical protein